MTELIYKEDTDKLYSIAADKIEVAINHLLETKEYVVLAIPGGRSVPGIFAHLKKKDIEWKKVHIFMVDERLVPIDHPDSNFMLAKESILDELVNEGKIPEENIHPFIFNEDTDDAGTEDYIHELQMHGGKYHIVLLSSGEDGHIGALYPDHTSITSSADYFVVMHDSPKPPPNRMSMSRELLSKASVAIIMFISESKRSALNFFLDKNTRPEKCPVKLASKVGKSYALTDIKL